MINQRSFLILVTAVLFLLAVTWITTEFVLAQGSVKRVTILCTNDTQGTLEPCGCGGQNTGGLPRRATFIRKVLSENPNCIIVESGNLARIANPSRPTAQLRTLANAFKYMEYTAAGVGTLDLEFGDKYQSVLKENGIQVIHTSLTEQEGVVPYIIKEVGEIKVGIVSFGVVPKEQQNDLDLIKRRHQVYSEARANCDILVLLDQANVATDQWLEHTATRWGAPDILLGAANRLESPEPKQVGQTMVVPTGTRGEYVNRIDFLISGKDRKLTFSRTKVDPAIEVDAEVHKMIEQYIHDERTAATQSGPNKPTQPYYHPITCVNCHKSQYNKWQTTKHAQALKTLVQVEKPIPECLPCHSEPYRRTNSVTIDKDASAGVECGACHFDVLPHGSDNKKKGDIAAIKSKCTECHTKERSQNFDLDTSYKAIKH